MPLVPALLEDVAGILFIISVYLNKKNTKFISLSIIFLVFVMYSNTSIRTRESLASLLVYILYSV